MRNYIRHGRYSISSIPNNWLTKLSPYNIKNPQYVEKIFYNDRITDVLIKLLSRKTTSEIYLK
jgi:hypothetical protein